PPKIVANSTARGFYVRGYFWYEKIQNACRLDNNYIPRVLANEEAVAKVNGDTNNIAPTQKCRGRTTNVKTLLLRHSHL
ncbi:MAG: hypothetical protein FWG65_01070, partial [Turicibacter sp.]|nr:hypothetical protein [Turicibacter sp.]